MAEEERVDDVSIPNTDRLFRRVPPNQLITNDDGTQRPTSAVFDNIELSVNIESLMVVQGRPTEECLTNYPNYYLTSVIVADVRSFGHPVVKDTAPPNDQAHGLVLGKKSGSFKNKMAKQLSTWVVAPPKVSAEK